MYIGTMSIARYLWEVMSVHWYSVDGRKVILGTIYNIHTVLITGYLRVVMPFHWYSVGDFLRFPPQI